MKLPQALAGMTLRERIDIQYGNLRDINMIIEELRRMCEHPGYRVGWYSWRVGAQAPKRLCNDCDHVMGEPSAEELKAFDQTWSKLAKEGGAVVLSPTTQFTTTGVDNG